MRWKKARRGKNWRAAKRNRINDCNLLKKRKNSFLHHDARQRELLLRITCWVVEQRTGRAKLLRCMAQMYFPVTMPQAVKPVSEEKQPIKRMPERWPLVV
ncbi:hypothetical protein PU37_19505 [Escherichia coli]|nr:hypothetical protein PU36_13615 [Escherichia coli]KIG74073.1 hypothetical protein PU37_19505 [Escherichia coli]